MSSGFLSERARTALSRHQRTVTTQLRDLQAADRVLSGALTACDQATQKETVETYLDTVQELRVSLQRLESFLLQKLTGRYASVGGGSAELDDLEAHGLQAQGSSAD